MQMKIAIGLIREKNQNQKQTNKVTDTMANGSEEIDMWTSLISYASTVKVSNAMNSDIFNLRPSRKNI